MTMPTKDQIEMYAMALRIMRQRIELAELELESGRGAPQVERAALHLRMTLETLLLSSLVTHQQELGPITRAITRDDPNDARKRVSRINPAWWPKPKREISPTIPGVKTQLADVESGALTEGEWGRAFGTVSEILHMGNPFAEEYSTEARYASLQDLGEKLIALLSTHTVVLPAGDYLFLAFMNEADRDVEVYLHEYVSRVEDYTP